MMDRRDGSGLRGIVPALATPFGADEGLDLGVLPALLDRVLGAGVHGVFVLGSQGEAYALDEAERDAVVERTVTHVAGRVPVVVGTGHTTTRATVEATLRAEALGADYVSVITPAFLSLSQAELYGFFEAAAGATSLPVLLYNNPGKTGNDLALGTIEELSQISNVVGIKDSSGDLGKLVGIVESTDEDFCVLVGRDTMIHAALKLGADGAVAATANVVPAEAVEIYEAFRAGDEGRAREAQRKVAVARETWSLASYPVVVKECLNLLGIPVGGARAPVDRVDPETRQRLREMLEGIGLAVGEGVAS